MPKIDSSYFNNDTSSPSSIEAMLMEDEEILLRLRPNLKDYILESIFKGMPVALIWAAFDIFFIILIASSGFFDEGNFFKILLIVGFFALHLLPLWLYIAGIVKRVGGYKNVEYVFTSKRIILRDGLILIGVKNILYTDIISVDVKVGLFDRLFKVGDIVLNNNKEKLILEDVDHPYDYASKIQKIVMDIKADVSYPNALRPETNEGYNTSYHPK